MGEAIHSVSLIIPEDSRTKLKIITNIRDHIIHSSTLDASNYVNSLLSDLNKNRLLTACIGELRGLERFFVNRKDWLDSDKQAINFPQVPLFRI